MTFAGAALDLQLALALCLVLIAGTWLVASITGNYSQVDRLWSIAPPVYVLVYAAASRFADPRTNLVLLLTTMWGARLTYNFARKGGYRRGHEDYRWPILRAQYGPTLFSIFAATFIAPFQNVLLFLLALPAFVTAHVTAPLNRLDVIAAIGFLVLLAGETIADQQQWSFHQAKKLDPTLTFLTTGLFRYSRHPSFFCEIAMWWMIYLFAVATGAGWLNVAIVGPALLTLLFQGSTSMTERITLGKHPSYAAYQRSTSRIVPLP